MSEIIKMDESYNFNFEPLIDFNKIINTNIVIDRITQFKTLNMILNHDALTTFEILLPGQL